MFVNPFARAASEQKGPQARAALVINLWRHSQVTDRSRQTAGLAAQFTIGFGLITLSMAIAGATWRASAMFTTMTIQHAQLFQIARENSDAQLQALRRIEEKLDRLDRK